MRWLTKWQLNADGREGVRGSVINTKITMHAKRVFFFFACFTIIKCRPQKRSKRFILTNNKMKTYRQGLDFSCIIEMCKNIWFLFFCNSIIYCISQSVWEPSLFSKMWLNWMNNILSLLSPWTGGRFGNEQSSTRAGKLQVSY